MKLLIVDESAAVYGRLLGMLGGVEGLTALAVARSFDDLDWKCRDFRADVVVLDPRLPGATGLSALQHVLRQCPGIPVYVYSNEPGYRARALTMGAQAFFDKSMEFESLVTRLLEQINLHESAMVDQYHESST
ncbi:MAG: response regulator [Pseudomonadota bacterium]